MDTERGSFTLLHQKRCDKIEYAVGVHSNKKYISASILLAL